MDLSDEDASLLSTPGRRMLPFAWTLFELRPKDGDRWGRTLVAIGTVETESDFGPKLEAIVIDVGETVPQLPHVMTGEGRVVRRGCVKLTTGDVMIHRPALRGRGLGYLVLNASVRWAQLNHPDASVEPITLVRAAASSDAEWDHEFAKLTSFYGKFGFRWASPPAEAATRHYPSEPMMVADLAALDEATLPLIRRIDTPASLTQIIQRLHDGADDRATIKALGIALRDKREGWRTIGYRLTWFGWAVALATGWLLAKQVG